MKYDTGLILAEIEFAKPMRRPGGAPVGAAKTKAGGAWGKAANFYALSGGSKAVVLKKIHNGGCKTSGSLGTQVNYVFGKAERIFGSGVEHEPEAKSLTMDERATMVKEWSEGWGKGRTPENGHTSHLLLSFPAKTDPEKAFRIAEAWAADMFDNKAQRGDSWSYMAALHIDRDHPHVHMIVKNRGRDEGQWFFMAQGATFDLKDMKQRVVELAAEAGLSLDASSRVERGILTYGPSRGEIEAARRQGREVIEKARTGAALHAALQELTENVKVLSAMAGMSHMVGDQARRNALNAMRDALVGRKPITHDLVKEYLMETSGSKATEFGNYVANWMVDTQKSIDRLPPDRRDEVQQKYNRAAALGLEAIGQQRAAELVKQPAQSALYLPRSEDDGAQKVSETQRAKLQQVVETQARTLGVAEDVRAEGATAREIVKTAVGRLAGAIGLDREAVEARIASGAPNALMERSWVQEDLTKVAAKTGRSLDTAEGRDATSSRLDAFYAAAAKIIAAGLEREVDRDRNLSKTMGELSKAYQANGRVQFANDENARDFAADMKSKFGPEVMREIASGKTDALARDIPDAKQREVVARAILSAAQQHEGMGITLDEANKGSQLYRTRAARGRDQGLER